MIEAGVGAEPYRRQTGGFATPSSLTLICKMTLWAGVCWLIGLASVALVGGSQRYCHARTEAVVAGGVCL